MNRKTKYYLKSARLKTRKALKNKKNLINFYIYFIPSLILRMVFFVFAPLFKSFDYKVASMIKLDKEINVQELFEPFDSKKRIRNSFFLLLELVLIYLGTTIFIFLITGVVALFGYLLGYLFTLIPALSRTNMSYILAIALGAPGVIVYVIYSILFVLKAAPTFYLDKQIDDTGISPVLKSSFKTMSYDGKATSFFNEFFPVLWYTLKVFLMAFITYFSYAYLRLYVPALGNYSGPIVAGLIILFSQFLLTATFRCFLVVHVSKSELYDDLFLREQNERIEGINIRKKKTKKVQIDDYVDNLVRLFDETEDMSPTEDIENKPVFFKEEDEALKLFASPIGEEEKPKEVKEEVKRSLFDSPKIEEVKIEKPKIEEIKAEEAKLEEVKIDEPKIDEVKFEEIKIEEPKIEEPKEKEIKIEEVPVIEEVKVEEVLEVKSEEPIAEEVKVEEVMEPVVEEVEKPKRTRKPKTEEVKVEETPEVEKPKRGRKPKAVVEETVENNNEENNDNKEGE